MSSCELTKHVPAVLHNLSRQLKQIQEKVGCLNVSEKNVQKYQNFYNQSPFLRTSRFGPKSTPTKWVSQLHQKLRVTVGTSTTSVNSWLATKFLETAGLGTLESLGPWNPWDPGTASNWDPRNARTFMQLPQPLAFVICIPLDFCVITYFRI